MNRLIISAQISLYPLRQEHLSPAIQTMCTVLKDRGLQPEIGPMSTLITGEAEAVFAAFHEAFVQASGTGHVVMTITVSNACPV